MLQQEALFEPDDSLGREISNEAELIKEATRVIYHLEAIVIEVAELHWMGPHTPFEVWHPLSVLSPDISEDVIAAERKAMLKRKRFFSKCTTCSKHVMKGYMHDDKLCCSCAEKNLGIVY